MHPDRHTHRWRIVVTLAMGIADTQGWIPKLLLRQCILCPYAETLHGAEHPGRQTHRLYHDMWEAWGPQGMLTGKEGGDTRRPVWHR